MSQFQYEVLSTKFFLPIIELMLSRLLDLPVWSLEKFTVVPICEITQKQNKGWEHMGIIERDLLLNVNSD